LFQLDTNEGPLDAKAVDAVLGALVEQEPRAHLRLPLQRTRNQLAGAVLEPAEAAAERQLLHIQPAANGRRRRRGLGDRRGCRRLRQQRRRVEAQHDAKGDKDAKNH
jgi:hypothetical protein